MSIPVARDAKAPSPVTGAATLVGIALGAFAFRCLSAAIAFIVNVAFVKTSDPVSPFGGTRAFWDLFKAWDGGWYFSIARYGYAAPDNPMGYVPGGRNVIGFFPAYPLLMRYASRLFGSSQADVYFGGIVVSWVAFIVAMLALYKLARLDVDHDQARRAVLYTAIFPFAYFFGVVYTESLFLAAIVGAFYFFRTRRWLLGGLCGALATATRVNGILIMPALAWIAWRNLATGSSSGRQRMLAIVALLLVPVGIGAYSLFIFRLTGHPLEWLRTIQLWGYYPGGRPWHALIALVRDLVTHPIVYIATVKNAIYDSMNGLAAIVFIVAVPFVWLRYGTAYGLLLAANLWLPLSSGLLEGLGRYCAVLFPFFIWLAGFRSRTVQISVLVVSAALYTLCMALFTNLQPMY
jgi:hypothetical protein